MGEVYVDTIEAIVLYSEQINITTIRSVPGVSTDKRLYFTSVLPHLLKQEMWKQRGH